MFQISSPRIIPQVCWTTQAQDCRLNFSLPGWLKDDSESGLRSWIFTGGTSFSCPARKVKSVDLARTSNGPGNLHEEGVQQVMWLLSRSSNKLWSTMKSVNGLCGLCLSSEKNLSGEVRRVWGIIAQAHSKNYRTEGDVSFIAVGARVYY